MCLIIVKPAGVAMPKDKEIVNGYNNNPDGFGLAYWEEGMDTVWLQKGIMALPKIFEAIDGIDNPKPKTIIFHFRFATHGATSPENCHPFPISANEEELTTLTGHYKSVVAHNGIIFNSTDYDTQEAWQNYQYDKKAEKWVDTGLSDTQKFIRDYLASLGDAIHNQGVQYLIEDFIDGKFAILSVGGHELIGNFDHHKGRWYSNGDYKQRVVKYVTTKKTTTTATTKPKNIPLGTSKLQTVMGKDGMEYWGHCDTCDVWAHLTNIEGLWICGYCRRVLE